MSGGALSLASLFEVPVGEYKKLTFDAADARMARTLIFAVCFGIALSAVYNFYQHRVPGGIVRRILAAGALSPESAKTAAELGFDNSMLALFELQKGTTLSHVVRFVGDTPDEGGKRPAQNAETRYYIPEEQKYRAELRFQKEGHGAVGLLLTVLLAVLAAPILCRMLPLFLTFLDSLL